MEGRAALKRLLELPPFLNYPHNGLLILSPPSLHSELFISFLSPLHTSQSCTVLYSYYPAPSYLTRSPSFCPSAVAESIPFFLLVLHIKKKNPTLPFCLHICLDLHHCQPPISPLSPPIFLTHSFLSNITYILLFSPPFQEKKKKNLFNETEDLTARGGDPHSPVPVCTDCLSTEWRWRSQNRIDEPALALLL